MFPGSNTAKAYEELAQAGEMTVRIRGSLEMLPNQGDVAPQVAAAIAEKAKHKTTFFQTNAAKFFADGVIEGHTGYLLQPYTDGLAFKGDANFRGVPIWQPTDFNAAVQKADKAGMQIHIHAIGDARREREPRRDRLRRGGQRPPQPPADDHPPAAGRQQRLRALQEPRRDGAATAVLVPDGRLLPQPPGAVPRPDARRPRVSDEELLRRRRPRRVGQRLPGHARTRTRSRPCRSASCAGIRSRRWAARSRSATSCGRPSG